jgi:hypothetical protein
MSTAASVCLGRRGKLAGWKKVSFGTRHRMFSSVHGSPYYLLLDRAGFRLLTVMAKSVVGVLNTEVALAGSVFRFRGYTTITTMTSRNFLL